MGYIGETAYQKLQDHVTGLPNSALTKEICPYYASAKMTSIPHRETLTNPAKNFLDRLQSDIQGLATIRDKDKAIQKHYFISLIDEATRQAETIITISKAEAATFIQKTVTTMETQSGQKTKELRTDRAREYLSSSLKEFSI